MNAVLPFVALMELLKLQVLASYGFLAIGQPLPFAFLSLVFIFALALDRLLRRTGMRLVFYYFFHALALAVSFFAVYALYQGRPLYLGGLFPHYDSEMLIYFSVLAACAIFWFRAVWLGGEKLDHAFCITRFDEGLAEFLIAFFLTAIVRVTYEFPGKLVVPYFLFGILALGSSKNEGNRKGGLSRRTGAASLVPVAATFVLAAIGLIFLVPALTEPARLAAKSLKNAGRGLWHLFIALIVWLFGDGTARISNTMNNGDGIVRAPPSEVDQGSGGLFATIVMWCFIIVAAAFILSLLAYLLSIIFRRLSTRVSKAEAAHNPFPPPWLRAFILACARFFSRLTALFSRGGEKRSEALAAYARLLACGRSAGAARRRNETPREYARRLTLAFPRAATQAGFIAESLEREIYGGERLDMETDRTLAKIRQRSHAVAFLAERAKLALRRLRIRR